MSQEAPLVPQYVLDDWSAALRERDPRAAELAYALALALPPGDNADALGSATRAEMDAPPGELSNEARALLDDAYVKYDALREGDFARVDFGNPNILAFVRRYEGDRVLIVNNLARVTQPVKFRDFAGLEGWDILNRVEFTFPVRAQLEPYECLWLLVE